MVVIPAMLVRKLFTCGRKINTGAAVTLQQPHVQLFPRTPRLIRWSPRSQMELFFPIRFCLISDVAQGVLRQMTPPFDGGNYPQHIVLLGNYPLYNVL